MELNELSPHWKQFRSECEGQAMTEEALYEILPPRRTPFQRVLFKASHYVGVYGAILICCQTC